ncbi:hypothetical protein [Escherichia coli]|uniref:hypothetical protein n=1 Tax=Escherichia coli TaxID=562 RepID=UPI00163B4CA0
MTYRYSTAFGDFVAMRSSMNGSKIGLIEVIFRNRVLIGDVSIWIAPPSVADKLVGYLSPYLRGFIRASAHLRVSTRSLAFATSAASGIALSDNFEYLFEIESARAQLLSRTCRENPHALPPAENSGLIRHTWALAYFQQALARRKQRADIVSHLRHINQRGDQLLVPVAIFISLSCYFRLRILSRLQSVTASAIRVCQSPRIN